MVWMARFFWAALQQVFIPGLKTGSGTSPLSIVISVPCTFPFSPFPEHFWSDWSDCSMKFAFKILIQASTFHSILHFSSGACEGQNVIYLLDYANARSSACMSFDIDNQSRLVAIVRGTCKVRKETCRWERNTLPASLFRTASLFPRAEAPSICLKTC